MSDTLQPHGPFQVAPSMGFPRQEYWSVLPFSPLVDFPDPALAGGFSTAEQQGSPRVRYSSSKNRIIVILSTQASGLSLCAGHDYIPPLT